MKVALPLFLLLTATICLRAQNTTVTQPPRHVRFKVLPGDSAVFSFNKSYELIEDSCADISRMAHYNSKTRKFSGAFKDINKNNSAQLISEGNYTEDGLKNGMFTCYYLNGILQSKGRFIGNKPVGKWDVFYETGKPQISFNGDDGVIRIINQWDETGKKIVDDGKGTYLVKIGYFSWKGKLENGLPDGTWHSFKTDDATQIGVSEEHFKKGQFIKGKALGGDYTDASRINLIPDATFPYTEAEKLHVSPINCNGYGHRHIVGARFSNGSAAYSEYIKNAVHPIISRIRAEYNAALIIHGKVSTEGILINLYSDNAFAGDITSKLSAALRTIPPLNPATADGKPIEQGFLITFTFEGGVTHYNYRFLPIKQTDVQ